MSKIQAKVYGPLKSLNFYRRAFSFEMKKQLVQIFVMPHFDYASAVYSHLDKTREKYLQVAHNACVRFVTGYVPFIPSLDVKSHITHCRLRLGWLSLASRWYLQLLVLFYRIVSTSSQNHLYRMISSPLPLFIISVQRLANRFRILIFEPERVAELNYLIFNIFRRAQINDTWRSRAIREGYAFLSDINLLPHPSLPL